MQRHETGFHKPLPTECVAKAFAFKGLSTVCHSKPKRRTAVPSRRATTARAAVLAFLADMAPETGDDFLSFKIWLAAYDDLRPDRGWPPLSGTMFAKSMQGVGCRRRMIDGRRKGKGRYVAFSIPMEIAA